MATFTDDFENLPEGRHGPKIDRPEFTLEILSPYKAVLTAVRNPLSEIKPGIWVRYTWGSHDEELQEVAITFKRDNVHRFRFVNYRNIAAQPCRFYDVDDRELGSQVLPVKSQEPVVCSSGSIAIKTVKVSVAMGPGSFIAFDDFIIDTI